MNSIRNLINFLAFRFSYAVTPHKISYSIANISLLVFKTSKFTKSDEKAIRITREAIADLMRHPVWEHRIRKNLKFIFYTPGRFRHDKLFYPLKCVSLTDHEWLHGDLSDDKISVPLKKNLVDMVIQICLLRKGLRKEKFRSRIQDLCLKRHKSIGTKN